MTKKPLIVAALLAVGLPAVVVLSGFQGHEGFRHHRGHGMMGKFIEWRINEKLTELKATEAQKQSILGIEGRLVAEVKAMHEHNQGFRASIVKELQQDTVDAAKIHALVDARAAALKGFADKVVDGVIEAHDVLTPEQRAQLFQGMEKHLRDE